MSSASPRHDLNRWIRRAPSKTLALYGTDLSFTANPINRHAIGDDTAGLPYGADQLGDALAINPPTDPMNPRAVR
jgi:hypothetical protein